MSFPFGPPVTPVLNLHEARAVSLRVFDGLVREYADLRLQREQAAKDLCNAENEVTCDILRVRLHNETEAMHATAQRLLATAMVMSGNRIFEACAETIEAQRK